MGKEGFKAKTKAFHHRDTEDTKVFQNGESRFKLFSIQEVIRSLLEARRYDFDVERAVYLSVLHRLFASGSDRAAERWL
jgi:hypothetical protein